MEEDKKDNGGYEAEGNALVGLIRERFQQAETSKIYDEKRWLKAYRNYRGLYGPETAFRENEKSRVFVKVTKTKVLASFGQIIEVLFSQGKFPLGVTPTSVPEGTAERAYLKPKQPEQPQEQQQPDPYGFNGDGREIPAGATADDLMKTLAQDYKNLGYSTWCMAAGWANWELLFVRWAERNGITLGFATSSDLDAGGELLEGYPAYVSVGHDEYWSKGMRDAVENYVDQGGNAAFFSGNTAFWQARFEDSYKKLVSYKTSIKEDPYFDEPSAPLLSTMWSDPLVGRPENQMTGVSFSRGGYARMQNSPRGDGGYQVMDPEHWIFSGLDVKKGGSLGAEGIVVGYECDGCVFAEDESGVRVTGEDGTPLNFSVIAAAPARLWETQDGPDALDENYIGELNWVAERIGGIDNKETRGLFDQGHAVMGMFRRKKGNVFTTGCTDWAYGLETKDVNRVTKNVMERFILGK